MANEIKTGFSGFGATGEGNNGWNTVGNLALKPDGGGEEVGQSSAEVVDFDEEKAKLEEAKRLREEIARKEASLESIERTIPNESFREFRKQELTGEIEQARKRLAELGDKSLSIVERVEGEVVTDAEFAAAREAKSADDGEPIDVRVEEISSEEIKEAPLAEEVAELEVKQILKGESLEARYEQIVQEFADKSSNAAAMRKMATEVVKNDGSLLAERELEVDSLRHQKEVLENYAREHGIELPGMPAESQSTDMAQYANSEPEVTPEVLDDKNGLSEEEQRAILADFDNRKVENENPSAEVFAKVNRANVERTALAMDMPELLEFYDQRIAERAAPSDAGGESSYMATAGEDLDSGAVKAEFAEDEDLIDDDVYNQRKAALEADLREMEAADGELPQLAQLTAGNALMNILRKRAQQELGIAGEDVLDDRKRKIGEKFSDEDEAKVTSWAERKLVEVEKYRELQDRLERLEEARAKALAKAGRTEEAGDGGAEIKTNSNDDFYAAFGRAKDRWKWLRESIDPDGVMPEEEFAMRFEQTAAAYEVWHNALADGVYEKIGEQKEKGLKGAWTAVKRFAKKQTRKLFGLLAGISTFAGVAAATTLNTNAENNTTITAEAASTQGDDGDLAAEVNARSETEDERGVGNLGQQAKKTIENIGLNAEDFSGNTYEVSANGVKSDYATYYLDFENKLRHNNYAPSMAEFYGDVDGSIDALIAIAEAQPEALASYITMCDQSVWQRCGINLQKTGDLLQDGSGLDGVISTNGVIQGKAIEVLKKLLTNEQSKASATFNEEYDRELTSYMYTMEDESGDFTPETMHLGYDTVQRTGEKQFNIDLYDENGVKVGSLDLNMDCGFQTNIELTSPVATYAATEMSTPVETVTVTEDFVQTGTPVETVTSTPVEVVNVVSEEPETIPGTSDSEVKQEQEKPPVVEEEEPPVVEEEEPDEQEPDEQEPDEQEPDEEDKKTEEEEQVKQKDGASQIERVEQGGQTIVITQVPERDPNVGGTTDAQGTVAAGNETVTRVEQQDDMNASEEEQQQNRIDQETADETEITQNATDYMTQEQINSYINGLVANAGADGGGENDVNAGLNVNLNGGANNADGSLQQQQQQQQ